MFKIKQHRYLPNGCAAFFQVKRELTIKRGGKDVSLSKLLLNADFIPTDVGKAGPELIACQV